LNIKGSEKNNLIVSAAGKIYTSGINWNGTLGIATGATGSVYTAGASGVTQLGALTNWNYPAVGDGHVGAVKTDGTLWTWGAGAYGQTGLGVTTAYSSPKQVGALTDWSAVFFRKFHSFGIKTNGTLWAWGKNTVGQLGVGNTTSYSSPKQVGALTDWAKIFPCEQGAFALKTDGTLWAWGDVHVFGSSVARSSPVQISTDTWNNISVAYRPAGVSSFTNTLVAAGIKSDGSLWVVENAGTSGLSGVVSKNIYDWTRIGTSNNWSRVSVERTVNTGSCWIAAIKNDGTMWTWGNGGNGRLGLGNQTSYSSPKQVGALTTWIDVFHFGLRTMAFRS
jgi:alpha-tubulin suppressor-like RCC1 family protein